MKYCQNCGAQLSDSAKFCPHCGTPVPSTAAPSEPTAPFQDQPAAAAPSNQPASASAANYTEPPLPTSSKKRWGIAAQFDAIAAGQKPQSSYFTYLYGFFQLLYHKSYALFKRTYLPCCIALIIDFGLLSYSFTAVPTADTLSTIAMFLLLPIAIWFVVVSIWVSRYYPQELYKQVGGNADRIPTSILPPVLGGVVLLFLAIVALLVGYLLSPVDSSNTDLPAPVTIASEPAEEEVLPEETTPAETPLPTESSTAQGSVDHSIQDPIADLRPVEDCCLVTENEPWKGAWAYSDGSDILIFENTMAAQDNAITNADGSITIYRADSRDGSVYSIFTLSSDQTTLTEQDAEGNLVQTYVRPTYDMAATPLPTAYWGSYTLMEDNTISELNPYGDLTNFFGPGENFIIDAFRIGKAPYNRLVDYGDGTWSAYFTMPPEGGYSNFGFVTEGEDLYLEIYDDSGNVRGRYLRTAR